PDPGGGHRGRRDAETDLVPGGHVIVGILLSAADRHRHPHCSAIEQHEQKNDTHGPELGNLARQRRHVHVLSSHTVRDRKSTRLNSSHVSISYAVFCLKKKKKLI